MPDDHQRSHDRPAPLSASATFRGKSVVSAAGLVLLLALSVHAAFAQVMLVPAPAPRYEPIPAPQSGHAFQQGHWEWTHGNYVWAPGYWAAHARGPYEAYAVPEGSVPRPPSLPPPPPPRVERLSTDALFAFGRGDVSDIKPSGMADLAEIAARLRNNHFGHVEVRGYTDRLGAEGYNLELSERRANAVKAVLVKQGVSAEKIRAEGLGAQDPIVQCNGPQAPDVIHCLLPNRRVEIVTYVAQD